MSSVSKGVEPILPPEPLVTAILPLKNYQEPFLRSALRSLFEQTHAGWRCLIVVEPADQAHFARLLEGELKDDRLRLILNRGRKLAGAINTGMQDAQTEFVAILLGDDRWSPDAVEVLSREIVAHPETDFFHSSRRIIDHDDRFLSSVYLSRPQFTLEDFKRSCPVKHLLCWRRSLGLAVGGLDESLNSVGPDDHDFPWTMAENGARFTAIAECLYLYRDHRDGFRLTTHLPLDVHVREIDRILAKHGMNAAERAERLRLAQQGFLRQCLYRSRFDRWWKTLLRFDPRRGWRDSYK